MVTSPKKIIDFCTVFVSPTTIYLPFVVGTFLMCGGPENTEPGKNLMSVFISSFEVLVMQRKMNIKHKSIALLISSMLEEKQSSMGQYFSKCLAKKFFEKAPYLTT